MFCLNYFRKTCDKLFCNKTTGTLDLFDIGYKFKLPAKFETDVHVRQSVDCNIAIILSVEITKLSASSLKLQSGTKIK